MTGGLKKNVVYSSAALVLLSGVTLLRPLVEGQLRQPAVLELRSQLNLLAGNYETALAQKRQARSAQPPAHGEAGKAKTCSAPQEAKKVAPKHS